MSTHTPGPWEFNEDFKEIQAHSGMITICDVDTEPVTSSAARAEVEANARLIAAAPELFDSLLALIAANEDARAEEDNWIRSGHDEAAGMDLETAQATVIIRENEARAILAKACPS